VEIKDLVGLEKPASELINRVSDAVGGIAKPWQMKRTAKAEVEIKKLHAIADLEISEIRQRAARRMLLEEEKNQANIEAVTQKALIHLRENARPNEMDEDFVRYLFDRAKLISKDEMQEAWATVLAGEANMPGSFSRRAIDALSQMSAGDAQLLTRFVRNVWIIGGLTPIIRSGGAFRPDDDFSLSFSELTHLESIGLIIFSATATFNRQGSEQKTRIEYYKCPVDIDFQGRPPVLEVGNALLTETGKELARITGAESSIAAFENALQWIIDQNIYVSIPLDAKAYYLEL
jgi:hypothetical protein